MSVRIYMASKTTHAPKWRALREAGLPIISTWIDEAGQGETRCFKDLWQRCVCEAAMADVTIVYREPGEILKGAFVEVGATLSAFGLVFAVGCDEFSFVNHPGVRRFESLELALEAVEALYGRQPFVVSGAASAGMPTAVAGLNGFATSCHRANAKWWQDPATGERIPRNKGELLMLIVSEIAEAMEGERKDLMDDKLPHRRMAEVELADALIRIFDYAGAFGYDLDGAVTEKLAFNATRADHTHEARLRAGGKKW